MIDEIGKKEHILKMELLTVIDEKGRVRWRVSRLGVRYRPHKDKLHCTTRWWIGDILIELF